MTPQQALSVLDQATQPGAQLTRNDYVLINESLRILSELIKATEQTNSAGDTNRAATA